MNSYTYGTGDRLEDRNTYFYSPYIGRDMFIFWKRQRDEAASCSIAITSLSPNGVTPTGRLIAFLLTSLVRGIAGSVEWQRIDKLLQRFEVSKRLHGEYNTNWRPVDAADYQCMEAYLCFAQLMEEAYRLSAKLQYLNVFLKSMDTITALVGRLNLEQRTRLEQLIGRERYHVENLALKIGVIHSKPLE